MAGRKKVLLVEDDMPYARYLLEVIGDVAPNIEMFHVNSGLAALSIMKTGFIPDVILSDVRMPNMDGYELLARIKGDPRYASIPFVIISALSDARPDGGPEAGLADLRLHKPDNVKDTLIMIERITSLSKQDRTGVSAGNSQSVI